MTCQEYNLKDNSAALLLANCPEAVTQLSH